MNLKFSNKHKKIKTNITLVYVTLSFPNVILYF